MNRRGFPVCLVFFHDDSLYLVFGRLGRAFGPLGMRGRAKVGGHLELHAVFGGEQQQLIVLQHLPGYQSVYVQAICE